MFARVENDVTNLSPKNSETPKILDQKQQFGVQFSMGNFHFVGRGKTNFFFWGGGNNNLKLASQ